VFPEKWLSMAASLAVEPRPGSLRSILGRARARLSVAAVQALKSQSPDYISRMINSGRKGLRRSRTRR
ncbi:MAG: hypothetical protein WD448_13975, partial [Woeseia sp.]